MEDIDISNKNSMDEGISWFHGKLSTDAAKHILEINGNSEGLFLVRKSSSSPGDFVLSLIHKGVPIDYQIKRHGEDAFFSIDDGPIIHGLETLISYYQDAQGLSTKLGHMCKGQPPPPDSRRDGRTNLLHRATKEGDINVVRALLKPGCYNLDANNQEGQTAVHLASISGLDDILDLLLSVGANPNIRDGNGLTPLHHACRNNRPSTASVLLNHKCNPQIRANDGCVPLHFAASLGFTETAKVLLMSNSPCNPRSNINETPLDLAVKNGHQECITLLENFVPPCPSSSRTNWFHENLDHEGTVHLLQSHGLKDGMFLVRRSTQKDDRYVLSVVHNSNTFNFEIQHKEKFYFIDDGPYLDSLSHVIDHYSRLADGLPTNLIYPLAPSVSKIGNANRKKEIADNVENSNSSICTANDTPVQEKKVEIISRSNLIQRESLHLEAVICEGSSETAGPSGLNIAENPRPREVPYSSVSEASIFLSINYCLDVFKLKTFYSEKFALIYAKVAQHFNLKVCEIILMYGDRLICIEDTPRTLDMGPYQVLKCLPFHKNCNTYNSSWYDNCIILRFQAIDSRGRKIGLRVHKLEDMKEISQRYSEIRNMAVDLFIFKFDGELITDTDTAYSFNLEHEDTIDVIYIDTSKKREEGEIENVLLSDSDLSIISVSDNSDMDCIVLSDNDSDVAIVSDTDSNVDTITIDSDSNITLSDSD